MDICSSFLKSLCWHHTFFRAKGVVINEDSTHSIINYQNKSSGFWQWIAFVSTLNSLTLFENDSITDINYLPRTFSLFHIDTWWGQSKYVRKFDISQANFEKTQNLYTLKIFLWILCIKMQNYKLFYMHVYYIMIKSSQKFWVVYVRYRFIPEQCALGRVPRRAS